VGVLVLDGVEALSEASEMRPGICFSPRKLKASWVNEHTILFGKTRARSALAFWESA
jgi:hypothetical protein